MPRYNATETTLLGETVRLVDAASFLAAYHHIFGDEIYRFPTNSDIPLILDCGANIGLGVIYWKRLYPSSRVIAFEPDPQVFQALSWNCERWGITNTQLFNQAVWTHNGPVAFHSEGADSGRVEVAFADDREPTQVVATRLCDFLNQPIDLLKLDIEGAEAHVLNDCQDHLSCVSNLFVEYHSFVNREQPLDEILRILKNSGFRLHITAELATRSPFVNRLDHFGIDNSLNIFAYRDRAPSRSM